MTRFASLGGGSASSYAAAGKAAAGSAARMFDVQRKTGPDYAGLSKVAMAAQTAENIAAEQAGATVAKAAIKATATAQTGKIRGEYTVKASAQKDKQRMAGILPAVGKIVGSAFKKDPKRPPPLLTVEPVKPETVTRGGDTGDRPQAPGAPVLKDLPTFSKSKPTDSDNSSTDTPTSVSKVTFTPSTSDYAGLQGNAKHVADAIGKYESGGHGYDAFNQGGKNGGTEVVGLSGSHATHFGKPLTSMTVGEVLKRQSGYDDYSISDKQWRDNGGLWAVGRYQFVGPTLKDEVARMGLSMDTPFNQKTQDDIFVSHAKRIGNISPWVGPMSNYNASERARLNNMIQTM